MGTPLTHPCWLTPTEGGCVLDLHVQPGVRVSAIVGVHGRSLKVRIAAPPTDGRANDKLTEFLAACLGVPRAQIEITAGVSGRRKRLRVSGIDPERVARSLQPEVCA